MKKQIATIINITNNWWTPTRLFLVLGTFFGLLWAIITPPFQAPDENFHFCRAYQLSDGHFFGVEVQGVRGDSLPVSVIETMEKINPGMRFHSKDRRQSLDTLRYYLKMPLQQHVKAFHPFPTSVIYPPTAYVPQLTGIWIGKTLHVSTLGLMYLGRFFNLAVWLLLMYAAIRVAPLGRWILAIVALMPMTLFLGASLNQDAMINGLAFLLLAYVLRLAQAGAPPSPRQYGLLLTLTTLLSFSKPGFALFSLLYLLLPLPPAGGRRSYVMRFLALLIIGFAASLVWNHLSHPDLNWNEPWASYERQTAAVLSNPFLFISAMFRSLWSFKFFYLRSHVGQLGWLDTVLPLKVIAIFLVALIVVALLDGRGRLSLWQKGVLLFTFAAIFGQTLLALYLVCSPVAGPFIHGMSGRYLLPIAPLFWLLLHNQRLARWRAPQWPWRLILAAFLIFALGRTTLVLIQRFYV